MAIVGLHLCGGAATPVGAFGWYGGPARGARPGVPPPSGTGPQVSRPDSGRAEGRGCGGAPRRRLKLAQKAGPGHWHPHELRHSGASLMLAQGTPLHVVSDVLGHASIAITKDVYGHLMEGDKRAATEAISGALLGRPVPSAPRLAPTATAETG
ncbi:tyrosine-type recombinase/integrase [Streptosporangium sp. 'caverna']|uniref:tyrosine-type recombinase/integrase n=1 Tax=Streptosporangium sp. 'caverna' TaxID=2202249 RepID=UPI001955063E|nr:tyrosine-type recombinase/integrase [Streptosporangium sp. 'caverna']